MKKTVTPPDEVTQMNTPDYLNHGDSKRMPRKRWFITYPTWPETPKDTLLSDLTKLGPATQYCIARETHKDGQTHYHAMIIYKDGVTKQQLLRHHETVYPEDYKRVDIHTVKSVKGSIHYLQKEDPNPLQDPKTRGTADEEKERNARQRMIGLPEYQFFAKIMLQELLAREVTEDPTDWNVSLQEEMLTDGTWTSLHNTLCEKFRSANP